MQIPREVQDHSHEQQIGYAALQAFFKIASDWGIDETMQCKLLGKSVGLIELGRLKEEPAGGLERDRLLRIRCLVMIYRDLANKCRTLSEMRSRLLSPIEEAPFHGEMPIKYILGGETKFILDTCKALTGQSPEQQKNLVTAA